MHLKITTSHILTDAEVMPLSVFKNVLCSPHTQVQQCTHNLIPWLAAVNQIGEENGILGAGQPASSYLPRALLDFDALIVLIDCLQQQNKSYPSSLVGISTADALQRHLTREGPFKDLLYFG